jgi:hypothetical protein
LLHVRAIKPKRDDMSSLGWVYDTAQINSSTLIILFGKDPFFV